MNMGILDFDEADLLDMAGPHDLFTTAARRLADHTLAEHPPLGVDRRSAT